MRIHTERAVFAVFAVIVIGSLWAPPLVARTQQEPDEREKPQVEMVRTIGCVELRNDASAPWWLTRAAEPTVTRRGVFNSDHIQEIAETAALGSRQFQLVGVADFLTPEGLLRSGDRALFTSPDQVNATGELRDGRTVLVKGLLIETDGDSRINLVAVVGMEDKCR